MADVVTSYALNLPAGRGASPIFYHDLNLGWSEVTNIKIVFPAGCAGLVGAHIEYATNAVYPNDGNQWFIFDDYVYSQDVSNQQHAGQWRVVGYNNDYNPHVVHFYVAWDYLPSPLPSQSSQLISLLAW